MASTASTVPLEALDVISVEEVSPSVWQLILAEVGYPSGLTETTFSKEALLDHLGGDAVSADLIEALRVINELGTADAVDVMKAVADAYQVDLGAIVAHAPRDAAAHLWLAQRRDPTLREVYTRIQMQAEGRHSPRTFREFSGRRNEPLRDWSELHPRLLAEIAAWCKQQGYGDHMEVRGYVKAGNGQIQIVHGHRKQTPVVVKDDGRGRRTVELRPVHCDVVRYDWKGARLRISPKSAAGAVVEAYRRMLGIAFFDDEGFFAAAGYSLRAIQERGQGALDASPTVARARLTELVWERGGDLYKIKSTDCLAAVATLGVPPTEGDFIEARVSLVIAGRRPARRNLHIKVPNRVDYDRDDAYAGVIESFLEASGIRVADNPTRSRDLWALHPWAHPERVWRNVYPDDVDELLRGEVLRAVELGRVQHPDRPLHGNALQIEDGFGISIDTDVPPRRLTPTDIAGLELNVGALIQMWRGALGLEGNIRDFGGGAYLLGERTIESLRCAVVALTRQPTMDVAQLGQSIRSFAPGTTIGLMVPRGRASGTALADVPVSQLTVPSRDFWRDFLIAAGAANSVPSIWVAPRDARLVIDRARKRTWLDGVELNLSDHLYRFVEILAIAKGNPVATETIDKELSSNRDETFARKVRDRLKKAIETSRSAAAPPIDINDVVRTARGKGYALALPPFVR